MKAGSAPNPRTKKNIRLAVAVVMLLAGFAAMDCARAADEKGEFVISAFSGVALTQNNDLRLREPGGTDLTFHDVSYHGRDFEMPPFYGGRVVYFLPDKSPWGFGLEYFHSKIYLNTGDIVHVTGSRAGAPVNDFEPVSGSISHFSISHGLNFVTADVFYRWRLGKRGENFLGRFEPYVGAGAGVVIPHVEAQLAGGQFGEDYQFHGPAVLAMAGLNFDVTKHFGLFAEYKFSYARLGELNITGGSIEADPLTHNLVSGISVRF